MNQKQNRNQRLQMVVPYFKREKSVRTIARENNICKSGVEYWIKEFQKVQMQKKTISEAVFIFFNKNRTHIKLLFWDDDGFVLYYKRLEQGRFERCTTCSPSFEIDRIALNMLLQDYLQVDESPIPVLDRDHPGATKRGFMWVYHWVVQKMVFFEYQKGRSGKFPKENLKAFKGFLQTDGYSGYKQFELNEILRILAAGHTCAANSNTHRSSSQEFYRQSL